MISVLDIGLQVFLQNPWMQQTLNQKSFSFRTQSLRGVQSHDSWGLWAPLLRLFSWSQETKTVSKPHLKNFFKLFKGLNLSHLIWLLGLKTSSLEIFIVTKCHMMSRSNRFFHPLCLTNRRLGKISAPPRRTWRLEGELTGNSKSCVERQLKERKPC